MVGLERYRGPDGRDVCVGACLRVRRVSLERSERVRGPRGTLSMCVGGMDGIFTVGGGRARDEVVAMDGTVCRLRLRVRGPVVPWLAFLARRVLLVCWGFTEEPSVERAARRSQKLVHSR